MSSTNVQLTGIPAGIKKPGQYFEYNLAGGGRTLPGNLQRVCLIGQRIATGAVPATTLVNVTSEAEARAQFGAGSPLHLMARAALNANPYLQLSAIALDDAPGALAATGKVTVAGTATATGTITLTMAADSTTVAVSSGDTAATVAANLLAAANTKSDWPVATTLAVLDVVFTAKAKGTLGNAIAFGVVNSVPGITVTPTSATPGWLAGGATDPALGAALTAIFTAGHTMLVSGLADTVSLAALRNHLTVVSGPIEQRDALGVYGFTGTLASATTLATAINHPWITGAWFRGTASLPYELAANYAAIIASEPDVSRPVSGLELPGLHIPVAGQWASRTEQEICLNNSVTPIEVGPGQRAQIVRAVTTYSTAPSGVRDDSLLDIATMRSLAYVRLVMRTELRDVARSKMTKSVIISVRSRILVRLKELESLDIVQGVDELKGRLIVEPDLQNGGQLNARIPARLVQGLHILAAVIDLL